MLYALIILFFMLSSTNEIIGKILITKFNAFHFNKVFVHLLFSCFHHMENHNKKAHNYQFINLCK